MKRKNAPRSLIWASLLFAPAVPLLAADAGITLEPPGGPEKNRFGVSYRAAFNITAKFKNVGNVPRGSGGAGRDPGPATGSDVDRFYDDGYNRVDISGNGFGLTSFWGFKNASQIVGDTVEMHSTTAASIDSTTIDKDPQHGVEITFNRELGRLGKKKQYPWGLEAGAGWTLVDIRDRRALSGGVTTLTDVYDLGGINPFVAPQTPEFPGHAGTYFAFNEPLIDSSPTRSITSDPNGARVTGTRTFDGNLWSFRLGPYIDFPINDDLTFSLSTGFAAGIVDGEFTFAQRVTTVGGTTRQTGSDYHTEVLWGGYASASIHYAIDEQWGIFAGGQYLGLADCYTASARGQKVELDLRRTAFFSAGITFSF